MSLRRLLSKRCTIVTVTEDATDLDRYGNPGTDETSRSRRCYFEPYQRSSPDERTVDRSTTIDEWLFVVAERIDVASIDHVTIDGEDGTFEVAGEPAHVWNPRRARNSHTECRLRRTQR